MPVVPPACIHALVGVLLALLLLMGKGARGRDWCAWVPPSPAWNDTAGVSACQLWLSSGASKHASNTCRRRIRC